MSSVAKEMYKELRGSTKKRQEAGEYHGELDMVFDYMNQFSKLVLTYMEVIHDDIMEIKKDRRKRK